MTMDRRTALVTGASAGMGAEFARQLAGRGLDLLLVARRSERLRELADRLVRDTGVRADVFVADLSASESPARIFDYVRDRGLHVDFLVNNAGSAGIDFLEDRRWTKQADYLELMMISVAQMCHLFVPFMCEKGYGRVINVASVAGRIARASDLNYGPSKAYVVAFSESLDLSVRASGVRVCALCPGFTHTDFHEVAGMMERKERMPKFIWYDASVVVKDGLKAVDRGKSVYISGRLYRWLDPLLQSVWTRRLIKRFM